MRHNLGVVSFLLLLGTVGTAIAQGDSERFEKVAQRLVQAINTQDYSAIRQNCSQAMLEDRISAVAGVFSIILALAFPWSAVGAIAGWFVGRYNARSWPRIVTEMLGALLGGCLGTIIFSMEQNETAARAGVLWGMGIGVVVGVLLPLLFVRALNSFADEWIRMRGRNG